MELKEILRTNPGLIGETTRVLTESYFSFLQDPTDLLESCRSLLEFRNGLYESKPHVNSLTPIEIEQITNSFYDNMPAVMLIFFFIECYIDEDYQEIMDNNVDLAYIVAIEEHKKTAKFLGHESITQIISEEQAILLTQIIENRY